MINIVKVTRESTALTLEVEVKASLFVQVVLVIVFFFSLLLPLSAFFGAISMEKMSFGILLGVSMFLGFITRSIFKQVIWHFYGREHFLISGGKVIHESYIKFFKCEPEEFEYENLEILFTDRELEHDERIGCVVFLSGENKIKSALKITETDFKILHSEYSFIGTNK